MILRLFLPLQRLFGYFCLACIPLIHVLEPYLGIPHGAEAWFEAMAYTQLTT